MCTPEFQKHGAHVQGRPQGADGVGNVGWPSTALSPCKEKLRIFHHRALHVPALASSPIFSRSTTRQ